ncbi:unnamed protein product [Discula destructiva]
MFNPNSTRLTVPSTHASLASPTTRPFILVPLYIYPAPGAWDPLYTAAEQHAAAGIDFYVIVNPANGPGADVLPDANYVVALERLTALPNVRVIGYVHCSYGLREAEEIVHEVWRYAGWEEENAKVGGKSIIVDGIFIDETPSSTEYVQYLAGLAIAIKTIMNRNVLALSPEQQTAAIARALAEFGKKDAASASASASASATAEEEEDDEEPEAGTADKDSSATCAPPSSLPSGILTPSTSPALVIYNPGVVVDPIFYQAADYVVAFENSCAQWTNPVVTKGFARLPPALLARSVPVAHSAGQADVVARLSRRAGEMGCRGLFVTSQPGYTAWCDGWAEFVGELARRTGGRC